MRLQKYLAHAGVASRRHAEEMIKKGRVRVNGDVVTEMGVMVDPINAEVEVDGKPVNSAKKMIYIVLNKPVGYLLLRRMIVVGRQLWNLSLIFRTGFILSDDWITTPRGCFL